jgi:RNA polymerase sigma-70 factor (sigma-E family)
VSVEEVHQVDEARVAEPKDFERALARPTFEEFVVARASVLLRTAWLLTGDRQLAEDLLQTAHANTWTHWTRIGEAWMGGYEQYVRKVMLTTYVAWWRRRWNGERPTAELPEPRGGGPAPADAMAAVRGDILKALATLPRGQRAVVVLRYFDDLTEVQTAAALGCSVGTVKSQCSKGLAALRRSPWLVMQEVPHG